MSSAPQTPAPRALVPSPPEKASGLKRWRRMAEAVPDAADLILIGDSLAAGWPMAPRSGLRLYNLGLPGDRIQNTLWRLGSVDLAHLRPAQVVVLLGTNNIGDGDPPDVVAAGLVQLAACLRALWPAARVAIFTVPRRGACPGLREAERREANRLAHLALPGLGVDVIDVDAALDAARLGPGAILGPDLLHLSPEGYGLLADALAALPRASRAERRPAM